MLREKEGEGAVTGWAADRAAYKTVEYLWGHHPFLRLPATPPDIIRLGAWAFLMSGPSL